MYLLRDRETPRRVIVHRRTRALPAFPQTSGRIAVRRHRLPAQNAGRARHFHQCAAHSSAAKTCWNTNLLREALRRRGKQAGDAQRSITKNCPPPYRDMLLKCPMNCWLKSGQRLLPGGGYFPLRPHPEFYLYPGYCGDGQQPCSDHQAAKEGVSGKTT